MIHASVELVEAMRGECPAFPFVDDLHISGPHARKACEPGAIANERIIWGYARGNTEDNWNPVTFTCPACLALMREAIGPERLAQLYVRWDASGAVGEIPWWFASPALQKENEK